MFRCTVLARKMSPFTLYVRESHAKATRKLKMADIGRKYRALKPVEKRALLQRAAAAPNPKLQAWRRYMKAHKASVQHLPPNQRLTKLAEQYRASHPKTASKTVSKTASKRSGKKGSARRHVKRAVKHAKK